MIANHALVLHQAALITPWALQKPTKRKPLPAACGGSSSTKAIISLMRRTLPFPAISRRWKRQNCGAGCGGRKRNGGAGAAWWTASAIWWPTMKRRKRWCRRFLQAAYAAGPGWTRRVQAGTPEGVAEHFLSVVRQQVTGAGDRMPPIPLKRIAVPLIDGLAEAAEDLAAALHRSQAADDQTGGALAQNALTTRPQELSTYDRAPHRSGVALAETRAELMVGGWTECWRGCWKRRTRCSSNGSPLTRSLAARPISGLHSHWVDPTSPWRGGAGRRRRHHHLGDADRPAPDVPDDWANAETRTGAVHLPYPAKRVQL